MAPELIANTIAGRLDLIRQNESLRAQLAKCAAVRARLQTQLAIVTNERDDARAHQVRRTRHGPPL